MAKNESPTKIVIPCRISFANIWEAKSINGSDPKYSVSCVIPKSDKKTLAKIEAAVEAAKNEAKGKKWGGKIPPNLKLPLRDGDIERPDDENYANCMFLNANSSDKPGIVDRQVNPILDPMQVYSGCYCNVSLSLRLQLQRQPRRGLRPRQHPVAQGWRASSGRLTPLPTSRLSPTMPTCWATTTARLSEVK